jgi:uncharacterized low-complexity protein
VTVLETSRAVWRRPTFLVLAAVAMLAAASATFAVHEATCQEDSCAVWVCAWMGNGKCGPDTPAVIFTNPFVEH